MQDRCEDIASPSPVDFSLSICILLGIFFSYIPQHYRIIQRRTSFGISPYFVLLGTTSGTSGLANILVLPKSASDFACCSEISGFACLNGLLGILQVGAQATCFVVILTLFTIYFPRATPIPLSNSTAKPPTFRTALIVLGICIVHAIATAALALAVIVAYPSSRQFWANLLGIIAASLASIQYFPQIYTTFRLRRVGSLSIPMMCIQTPGSLVWAGSLGHRLGAEGWSTWGVYLVTALLQGTLLAMGVYFEYISPSKEDPGLVPNGDANVNNQPYDRNTDVAQDDDLSEETPLLQSS